MSKGKWTPGPWTACRDGECRCSTVSNKESPVAKVYRGAWGDDYPSLRFVGNSSLDQKVEAYIEQITYGNIGIDTAIANARLISAAPEMFEALEASEDVLVNLIGMYGDSGAGLVLKEIRSALSKARGE